jgi:hypothetical protein
MRKLLVFFFILIPFFLPAQTAEEMDLLLGSGAVSYDQAARFVLGAADLPPAQSGISAFDYAYERGWISGARGDFVNLGDLSLLIMRAFDIKGGLLYTLFHRPRHANREMAYKKLIPGRTDPSLRVSGERLLQILSKTLAYTGRDQGGFDNE